MSFLGLSSSPSNSSPDYLLDDEDEAERSVAWGRIFFVLILLGAAGGLGWQYYRGGYPFAPRPAAPAVAAPVSAPEIPNAPPAAPAASSVTPAPVEPVASAPAASDTSTPAEAKTEPPAETKPAAPADEIAKPEPEKSVAAAKVETKPARARAPAPAPEPPVPPGEALYVQGQRYLYGTGGVQSNCDLALKSLMAAAARAHTRAQSTLGTMYSTGHCVTRDLPSAYKWFAKALHADPNNTRLEQNLSVVWRQMTPGERQLAMQN